VKQKHTQFPGPGRTEHNVVGNRLFPTFAAKATGLFFIVFGICAGLGGLVQINPVWLWGPYNAAQVSSASQPDWYVGFLDGSTRLFPAWDIDLPGNYNIPALFWPTVVLPGIIFTLMLAYPFLERKLTRDTASHHLLQRPRDVPVRTSLGAMAIAFWGVLFLSGGNDVIADKFDISLNAMTWIGRISLIVVPPIVYFFTYRICLGLEQHDREVLEHGIETGVIRRLPSGEFIEVHQPLGPVDAHGHGQLAYGGAPVPKKMNQVGGARRAIRGFFTPIEEPSQVELEQREEGYGLSPAEAAEGRELTSSGRPSEGARPSEGGRPQEPRD
jgi:ubiquinol-cytochrome c reductase cytochrome b subunit